DRIDVATLRSLATRWHDGEERVWSVARVPTIDDEDRRQLHRDLMRLKAERTEHDNRIKGLLAGLGLSATVDAKFLERLERLRQWDGSAVPSEMRRGPTPQVPARPPGRCPNTAAGEGPGGPSPRPDG